MSFPSEPKFVTVARILRARGNKGEVAAELLTDFPERLPEIKEMFLRERAILAISWLRRTRARISLVMRAHVAAVGQIDDLHLATELKLALSYLVVLTLCDLLIVWIWLRGPVRTRKMVGRTLRTVAWLRGAFEQLMARVSAEI